MTGTTLATWILVAFLAVATPGIDTVLVLRHTIASGARSGLSVVAGIAGGCLVWSVASLAGLTALLTASQVAYDVVRLAGAAYLVWLGVTALLRTLPRRTTATRPAASVTEDDGLVGGGLRAGFVTNLLNPKVGVFYISLLPQFLPAGPHATAWGGVLVAVHLALTLVWYPALIAVAARARALMLRERIRAWMERVTATVMIGVGVRLATEVRT